MISVRNLFLTIAAISAYGVTLEGMPLESNSQKIEKIKCEIDELQQQIDSLKASVPDEEVGATLAPASPFVDGERWALGLEYIFWETRTEGTEYAYSNSALSTAIPISGNVYSVKPGWTSGVRLFGAKYFAYDRWSLQASFTFLRPNGSSATASALSSARIPLRGVLLSNTYLDVAKASYNLDYYDLEVNLGRDFYVSKALSLRPFFGLESVWFDQTLTTRYSGGDTLGLDTVTLIDTSDLWGMGPEIGLSSGWFLGLGFKITASSRVALPFGYVNSIHNESHSRIAAQRFYMKEQKHQFNPFAQGRIAAAWSGYVNKKKQYIDVSFGYDFTYFFGYNEFITVTDVSAQRFGLDDGNVSMQGIGFRLAVSF